MRKLILAMLAVLTLTMLTCTALAVDYTIPDPEHFFGQRMEETSEYNYVMYFDEDPGDMYDAYMALLLNEYNMRDLAVGPRARIFSKIGGAKGSGGMNIKYSADDKGYSITFYISPILQPEKREQYAPNWADAQESSAIVLPHPGHYFGDKYYDLTDSITFDESPKAEFDAYSMLLVEKYGLEIIGEYHGENKEYYRMTVPGADNAMVYIEYAYEYVDINRKAYDLEIAFSGSITLSELDVYTASSACGICGGDGVCDTCGGKGYLEMKAYGSNDTVRIACTGGCAEGKCPACGGEQTTSSYTPPIVGKDGLLVMSPEQYLGIDPCDELHVGDDGSYIYYYAGKGAEWNDRGSDAEWAKLESYVQALIDSGYYMEDGYKKSSYSTHWYLRYIGPAMESSGASDIHVHCTGGRAYVSYRHPYIAADDLQEKLIYFNMDDPIPNPDDPTPTTRPNYPINDKTRCSNCGGDGETNCMSCSGKGYNTCSGCNGSGDRRCGSCNGTGTNGSRNCTTCSGRGRKTCSSCSGSGKRNCTACSGDGKKSCSSCGGDGYK